MKTVLAAYVAIFLSTAAHSEPLPCEPLLLERIPVMLEHSQHGAGNSCILWS